MVGLAKAYSKISASFWARLGAEGSLLWGSDPLSFGGAAFLKGCPNTGYADPDQGDERQEHADHTPK